MGGSDSKLNFRKAVVQLTTKKTVSQVVVTSFAANLSNSVSQGSAKWPLHLIGTCLARSLMVNRLCFQAVEATDDTFWDQFWSESSANISDVFTLIPASEIRALRDENPSNLATLCYKVGKNFDSSPCLWHRS